jgi:peptide/nickel transport system substrate-binding protein
MVQSWQRGTRVVLAKNPNYWQADRVHLDRVEWVSMPDDNTRMLAVQTGELDAALFVPFSRVGELREDPNLTVHVDPSTFEYSLLINNDRPPLGNVDVRRAIDMLVDKEALVQAVTFGLGQVPDSYIPHGALFHADNPARPHDPAGAKAMLAAARAPGLKLSYIYNAGSEVEEQIAVLLQQQLKQGGITLDLRKVDPANFWSELEAGNFDLALGGWTNDSMDADQKTTFALGHDSNLNFMTRYRNDAVKSMVDAARIERDAARRQAMYVQLQQTVQAQVPWVDLVESPFVTVSRKPVENFYQNPLGRFFLEDTVKK